jgi:uncharacterized protein
MMRSTRFGFSLLLAVLLLGCTATGNGASASLAGCAPGKSFEVSPAGLEQIELCITSGSKTHRYTVEIAATPPQQAKGMMFRTELADNRGMLFPFDQPRMASFWMKNTVIPLDIIFIRSDGRIENIAENAIPYSTDPVGATAPVTAVLELRGGLTAELGIAAGDKVSWK